MNNNLVLHSVILKKPKFKTKQQAFNKANKQFPDEHLKGFVRETKSSFRVRVVPKTKFNKTTFVSKILSPNETLVWGTLKR